MKINIDNGNVKVKFESQNELEMNSPEHFIDILYPYFKKLKNDDKIRFLLKLGEYFTNNYIFNFALHLFLYIKNNLVTTDQQLLFELNYQMGFVYESLKDIDKAIEHSNEALRIAEERKNESHIAQCINNIGGIYYNSNQFDKAIEYDTKALNLAKKIGDKTLEGKCLLELGNSFRKQGNYSESINYYKDSLERQKKTDNSKGEIYCLENLYVSYRELKEYPKAIEYLSEALKVVVNKKNHSKICAYNNDLGTLYAASLKFDKAIEHFNGALNSANNSEKKLEIMIHNNLGNLFDVQYDSDKAIEHYTKALKIAEEIDDNYLLLFTLKASGKMFYKFNLFDKSIEHYTKALKIAEEIGDDSMNSEFYNFIGNSYDELSDIEKAIEFHNKVLEISKENKWKDGESISLSNLGIIYYKIGDFERAIEFHDKAIEIAHTTGNIDLEGSCYGNLGNALLSSGDSDLAIICHEESLTLKIRSKNRLGELKCYGNLGNVYNVQAEFDKAIEYHSKALKIAEEIKDFTSQSICHIGLSQSYTGQNNLEKAKHHMEASLRISQQIGNLLQEIRTSYYLGKLNSFDSLEDGYFYVKKSVELIDNLGKKLLVQENKIEFYAFMYDIYSFIVYLSYKLNKSDELFRYIEKSKSNAFINLLSLGDFRINEKYHSKDILLLLDEEKKYLTILKSLETNTLISYKDSKIHYSIKEIEKIYNKLKEVYGKLEHYIPAYVSLRRATYLELPKIQNILSLQGNPVIIEYFILDRSLLILIISKNNYQIIEREISKERLEKLVFDFLKNIKNQKYGNKITNSWLELSNILIKPIDKLLKHFDFIYIIPNDFLYYIPIHALELNSKPLIQTYPVIYLQSASMLQFYNTKGSGELKTCASFGVVFLSEAKQVSHIFNSNLFINATKDDVTSNLEHDILHFSCHGEFNTKDPLKSCIHLHHSSLTIKDIFELKINSEIVTLSACETGISKIKKGDELIGLIRSFSYAGAASLLVTLWEVDALATEKFMKKFYSNLKKGYNKIKSLQIAQLYVMEKYPDPFYWSPFVLWGDFD